MKKIVKVRAKPSVTNPSIDTRYLDQDVTSPGSFGILSVEIDAEITFSTPREPGDGRLATFQMRLGGYLTHLASSTIEVGAGNSTPNAASFGGLSKVASTMTI